MKMMNSIFNLAGRQSIMKMLKRRRNNNRGVMWASLISLGISAIVMAMRKGQRNNMPGTFQNMLKKFTVKNNGSMMNNTALTEFSNEFSSKSFQNKQ